MIRVFSYGGGVQSTAALVLAAQGKLDYKLFLFANVGDDSENPATLRYIHDVALPYAEANEIDLQVIRYVRQSGQVITLREEVLDENLRAVPIPMRMSNGMPGTRACTSNYKARPLARELKRRGATRDDPARVGLGISIDEFQRMNQSRINWQVFEYPLIDLRLSRQDCHNIIVAAGLPVPPKSSCWFCPFWLPAHWTTLRAQDPEQFQQAVDFERAVNEKRARMGKPPIFIARIGRPLDTIGEQGVLDLEETSDACEGVYCMT